MKPGKHMQRLHKGLPQLDRMPSYVPRFGAAGDYDPAFGTRPVPVKRGKIKPWMREHLMRNASRLCPYCAVHMRHPMWGDEVENGADERATVDHIIPLSKGGGHVITNMQIVCQKCNVGKGNSDAPAVAKKAKQRKSLKSGETLYD